VVSIVACAVLASEKTESAAAVENSLGTRLFLAGVVLSIATTIISTTLIVYRILSASRSSSLPGNSTSSALRLTSYRVIEIIVESAALSSVTAIIMLPFIGLTDIAHSTSASNGVIYVETIFGYVVVSTRTPPA
jgi:hypothetical protein